MSPRKPADVAAIVDPKFSIFTKPLPATFAVKYDITGNGFICVVNIQIASHEADGVAAGAEALKTYLGRLTAAVEAELHLIQKQDKETVN